MLKGLEKEEDNQGNGGAEGQTRCSTNGGVFGI